MPIDGQLLGLPKKLIMYIGMGGLWVVRLCFECMCAAFVSLPFFSGYPNVNLLKMLLKFHIFHTFLLFPSVPA